MKVLIDTDPGIDDALAYLYALASDEIEIVGLTTVFGNVSVDSATRNALWLTERTAADVRVARGASGPLSGQVHLPAVAVHGESGFGHYDRVSTTRIAEESCASDFILERVAAHGDQLRIVALGPLTNIALALRSSPTMAAEIGEIVVMGGAIDSPGNVTPLAEANIHNDPEAARIVLDSGAPVTLIPLDVTDKTLLTPRHVDLLSRAGPEWSDFLNAAMDHYFRFYRSKGFDEGAGLHDPATLVALTHPELFEFVEAPLEVDVSPERRGRMFVDTSGRTDRSRTRFARAAESVAIVDAFTARCVSFLRRTTHSPSGPD